MLKGKTKIELIDTRNGHIDTYENTNMFTNGIQELLSYTSVLDNNKFQSNIDSSGQAVSNYNGVLGNNEYPTINYFTGGLLLFQNNITEDATITNIPADNKIIGRACLENNESTQTGSRNGSLISKGFTNNYKNGRQYKYEWEFNETQANGVISCVSLTTPLGAVSSQIDDDNSEISYTRKYPYTDNFYKCISDKNGKASNTMFYRNSDNQDYFSKNLIVLVDGTNNCYYCLSKGNEDVSTMIESVDYFNYWKNNRKILLNKYRFPYNNFSIFDDREKDYFQRNNLKLDSVEIDIPSEIPNSFFNRLVQTSNVSNGGKVFFFNDESYLYIIISNLCHDIYGGNGANSELLSLAINNDTNGQCFLLKVDISTFTVERTINLGSSNINNFIYSYKSGLINDLQPYLQTSSSGGLSYPNNLQDICNRVNDIYIFNNRLYCFIRENVDNANHSSDLVLCSINLDNFSDIKRIKFKGQDIIIHQSADSQYYEFEAFRGTHGTFENINFPLGVPFVYMIADKDNLYITFINNKKTFVINNSEDVAYVITGNEQDNPFLLNLKYELSEPVYPQFNAYPYWNGTHPLYTIYTPMNEMLFYIIGGNGRLLKLKNKKQYGSRNNNGVFYRYTSNGIIDVKYYNDDSGYVYHHDCGCYDIINSPTKLITINNLENTIEKKPYQKMKVTYTITEV